MRDLRRGRQPGDAVLRRIDAFLVRHPDPIPELYVPRGYRGHAASEASR